MVGPLYANEPLGVELSNPVYAFGSTTMDLSLPLFPWVPLRSALASVKLFTLLDLRGNIPTLLHISAHELHGVNILDQLIPDAGALSIVDCGHVNFERLVRFGQAGAFLLTRAKRDMRLKRLAWRNTDRSIGVIWDHTIALPPFDSKHVHSKPCGACASRIPRSARSWC